jgi:hypothetical protein
MGTSYRVTPDDSKRFQQDQGLKVDGFMRPGGPTEQTMNVELAAAADRRQPNTSRGSEVSPNIKDPTTGRVRTVPPPWGTQPDGTPNIVKDKDGNRFRLEDNGLGLPSWKKFPSRTGKDKWSFEIGGGHLADERRNHRISLPWRSDIPGNGGRFRCERLYPQSSGMESGGGGR